MTDSFKTDFINDRAWTGRSQLELATVEYVGWFNHTRLHQALGDIPPAEFEHQAGGGLMFDPVTITRPQMQTT